jgi:hypothetical protein
MPFTFAHAAAGVPLRRLPLVWSAFFIGTFAPDFEYFLYLAPQNSYGHHFPGIFTFTFPLAVLTLWMFHQFVKEPLAGLLPVAFQRRLFPLQPFRWGGARRFGTILASMAIGIFTHLVWDSFTHASTWTAQHWPVLMTPIHSRVIGVYPLVVYLQLGTSVLGMLLLAWWIREWFINTQPSAMLTRRHMSFAKKIALIASMLAIAIVGAALRASEFYGIPQGRHETHYYLVVLLVAGIALCWWQLVGFGILQQVRSRATR